MNTVMVEHEDEKSAEPLGVAPSDEATFRQLLINTLISGVTSSFLWFALTFWVYLETRSVVATGVIGGAFSLSAAFIGPAFGTFVDHHRKHAAMMLTTATSTACFAAATVLFLFVMLKVRPQTVEVSPLLLQSRDRPNRRT